MKASRSYSVSKVTVSTPVLHKHSVETYGMLFKGKDCTIAWITDTGYFDELAGYYASDLLVINMVLLEKRSGINHLTP